MRGHSMLSHFPHKFNRTFEVFRFNTPFHQYPTHQISTKQTTNKHEKGLKTRKERKDKTKKYL